MHPNSAFAGLSPSPTPRRAARRRPRGLTLIEVLIAAAVVLMTISGAAMMFANPLAGVRELKAEARLDDELRGAIDLVLRDLRGAAPPSAAAADTTPFRLHAGAVQRRAGAGWSDVTDRASVAVQGFSVTPHTETVSLGDSCPRACTAETPHCPTATLRSYEVLLSGHSVAEPALQRSLRSTVRVRNDEISGQCPA